MTRAVPSSFPVLAICAGLILHGCDCKHTSGNNNNGDGSQSDGALDDGASGDGALGDGSHADVPVIPPPDVHVLITADNAYGFGYGSSTALTNYFMGIEDNANDIFVCSQECGTGLPACTTGSCDAFGTCNADRKGPETYIVPGEDAGQDGYLYVIAWSDEAFTQGLIGQFRASDGNSPTVYTGSSKWEVCATGVDIDPVDTDPTIATINAQIANCNLGAPGPSTSDGWMGTELGNNPRGKMELSVITNVAQEPPGFGILCRAPGHDTGDTLDADARWMWFDDDNTDGDTAFESNGDPRGDFLIFRLPISAVIIID